jgi:hypothetical protein
VRAGRELSMANSFGIAEDAERAIRARDKKCVYCGVSMRRHPRRLDATIEHFNNNGPFAREHNLAICCRSCNSSKGRKTLLAWFETDYCRERNIHEKTVAAPVRKYLRLKSAR